ncbi:MAG TPA: chemotaxis protein CheD [bacterium]|nr:chemotaxis protein CheD [bacterium]
MTTAGAARPHFILPGELTAGRAPGGAATILGSCVALVLWDEQAQCGGMNHYMLAAAPAGLAGNLRFGSESLPRLLARVLAAGAERRRLVAKLFGGGAVLDSISDSRIGDDNVAVARAFVAREQLTLAGEHVGQRHGLKLFFDYASGRVQVYDIQRSEYAEETETTLKQFHRERPRGDILVIAADAQVRQHVQQWLALRGGSRPVTLADNMFTARTLLLHGRFAAIIVDGATPHLDLDHMVRHRDTKHRDCRLIILQHDILPVRGAHAMPRAEVLGEGFPSQLELRLGALLR